MNRIYIIHVNISELIVKLLDNDFTTSYQNETERNKNISKREVKIKINKISYKPTTKLNN